MRFCSDACRKLANGLKTVNPNRMYSSKRRAAMRRGDKIDRIEVFNHFNWICNICNEEIDRKLKFPDKRAATLEHIVPLARGGRHVWENVAPAHAECNEAKGSSVDTRRDLG